MSQMLVQPSGVLLKTVRTRWIHALVRHASVRKKPSRGSPEDGTKTMQVSSVNNSGLFPHFTTCFSKEKQGHNHPSWTQELADNRNFAPSSQTAKRACPT
jgi:hypothetical protein